VDQSLSGAADTVWGGGCFADCVYGLEYNILLSYSSYKEIGLLKSIN
jgi:hypothetical protein